MAENEKLYCPHCEEKVEAVEPLDRRGFIRVVRGSTASLVAGGAVLTAVPQVRADAPAQPARQAKPAEALIEELYGSMTAQQRRNTVLPWNHGGDNGRTPTRKGMYNSAINNQRIGDHYTRAQQELIERILRSISSGEEGYRQLCRQEPRRAFDGSGSMQGCGVHIFGEPGNGQQYAWVFSGHHLTVRCDGNSEPDAAF